MHATAKRLPALLFIAMTSIAMSACSHMGSSLDQTHWKLTAWSISSRRAADTGITATFADGNISGSSGVNTYAGSYKAASGGAFSLAQLQSTEMAGPEPAMRAESAYMTLLGQAALYKRVDNRLTLYGKGGKESLIFELTASDD